MIAAETIINSQTRGAEYGSHGANVMPSDISAAGELRTVVGVARRKVARRVMLQRSMKRNPCRKIFEETFLADRQLFKGPCEKFVSMPTANSDSRDLTDSDPLDAVVGGARAISRSIVRRWTHQQA